MLDQIIDIVRKLFVRVLATTPNHFRFLQICIRETRNLVVLFRCFPLNEININHQLVTEIAYSVVLNRTGCCPKQELLLIPIKNYFKL